MSAFLPDYYVQIDVKAIGEQVTRCNLYTGVQCVEIVMRTSDYEDLMRKGFFIRDGKERDSAGVLNTTDTYFKKDIN